MLMLAEAKVGKLQNWHGSSRPRFFCPDQCVLELQITMDQPLVMHVLQT